MKHQLLQVYLENMLSKLGFSQLDGANLVYFWKPKPKVANVVDAACCCQWWYSRIEFEGVTFVTAEHAMMYGKAKMFGDQQAMDAILEERLPHVAKSIGRQVRNFNNRKWEDESYALVKAINKAKFTQDPRLKKWLLSLPENTVIVETSPYDRIWGIGLAEDEPVDLKQLKNWQGQNKLGFAITEVLQELRNEQGS